jgi:hypothetical protein
VLRQRLSQTLCLFLESCISHESLHALWVINELVIDGSLHRSQEGDNYEGTHC